MCERQEAMECEGDLFCGVNRAKDPAGMTDLEKKHVPLITAPDSVKKGECFEVTIEVGKHMAHPNQHEHHIRFAELYADNTYLGRVDFTAVTTCPVATFCVQLDHIHKQLRAFAYCNMHGAWEGGKPLQVTA